MISTAARREDRPRIAGAERRERRDPLPRPAPVMPRNDRSPSMRRRGIKSSGPSVSSATSLIAAPRTPTLATHPSSARRPACGRRNGRTGAHIARGHRACRSCGMLRHDPCATPSSIDKHDGRPMKGVDELRRDDADDAAVPALTGDDEHRARRRRPDRVCTIFFAAARISASSSCRRMFSAIELQRQRRTSSLDRSRRRRAAAGSRCPACSCVRPR